MKRKIAVLAASTETDELSLLIQGMEKAVKDQDTDLYVFVCKQFMENSGFINKTGFSIFDMINFKDFDGAILVSDLIEDKTILEKLRKRILDAGIPAVSINRRLDGIDFIGSDNYSGFYDLITHLISVHKITKFAFLLTLKTSLEQDEKYSAFNNALKEHNITLDNDRMIITSDNLYESGVENGKKLFIDKSNLPQAIVCSNDWTALGVLKAAEECNIKVPDEVKIVGFDDIEISKCTMPSLTTVDNRIFEEGEQAAKRVLQGKDEFFPDLNLKTTPVFRQSCGCETKYTVHQQKFSVNYVATVNNALDYSNQLHQMEEVFLQSFDVYTLLTNLDNFFFKNHSAEGSDFCIFLKTDWTNMLINSEEELGANYSYGNQLQTITNIQKNRKLAREIISTSQLVPQNMISSKSDTFVICPIYHHTYVHGYFLNKNNSAFLDNSKACSFAITIGTNIERFRQKNMYKQMSQQFLRLSTKDALSGMLNRIGLEKLAKPFFEQNKKQNLTTFLLFADINSMKTINDKFGHLHGDLAVKTIADAILTVIPKTWMGIRYGGDEFLIIGNNKNYNNEDYLALIQNQIISKTSKMMLPYNLSASLGYYPVPPTSELTLEQAISKVDEIMYIKKQEYHRTH